jgi:hypothetical protein
MIQQALARGAADAFARFGIKNAGFVGDLKSSLIGTPGKVFVEGPKAFTSQGSLSPKNVFWPATSGPGGSKLNWLPRAGTLMAANQLRHTITDDSDEPRLPRVLGAAGGLAGMMYGQRALGMLGAPLASGAGVALGRGLGNLLR